MPWEPVLAGFGVAAAALLVGGSILLRYQRDRHHFLLMKAAVDKGITSFPGASPGWLISMRVGTLAMVLGVGLTIAGIFVLQGGLATATEPQIPVATEPAPPPAPPPGPAQMDRWRRVRNEHALGFAATCAGAIITLLGVARLGFARLEKKYAGEATPPSSVS